MEAREVGFSVDAGADAQLLVYAEELVGYGQFRFPASGKARSPEGRLGRSGSY